MIAFIQPFALRGSGGGARILRALLQGNHRPVVCINTDPSFSGPPSDEIHLPLRRSFGRLEYTRFRRYFHIFDQVGSSRFAARLDRILRDGRVQLVHMVHQSYDLVPISRILRERGIPLFLTIHDDFEYTLSGHPCMRQITESVARAWRDAKGVFVISEEMGREYARRFGVREFTIVTDGLARTPDAPQGRPEKSLRLYFMGLFHLGYGQNLRAVLNALKIIRARNPDWDISFTSRSGDISTPLEASDVPVRVLPFAPEAEVEKDLLSADLLYQPLPFYAHDASFGKFSLSTKMVTYLGSGLPIFYHGPEDAAACHLLNRHQAAGVCTTLDSETVAEDLLDAMARRKSIVRNALALAQAQFMLADQQQRFWQPMMNALADVQPAVSTRQAKDA